MKKNRLYLVKFHFAGEELYVKNFWNPVKLLDLKGQTLFAQVIELQKLRYDKINNGDPRKGSDKYLRELLSHYSINTRVIS